MAEVFNRASDAVQAAGVAIYTAPNNASTDRAVVLSVMVANVNGSDAADVSLRIQTAAGGNITGGRLAHTISIAADSSLELIANKLVLKNGEKLFIQASVDNRLEATVSALEMT